MKTITIYDKTGNLLVASIKGENIIIDKDYAYTIEEDKKAPIPTFEIKNGRLFLDGQELKTCLSYNVSTSVEEESTLDLKLVIQKPKNLE